jgi:exopolysaccharide biosynthesis protein
MLQSCPTSTVRIVAVTMVGLLLLIVGTELPPTAALGSDGYEADLVRPLAPGIEYRRLVRSDGPVVAHVVRVQHNSSLQLQAVLSNDLVAGPPPTTELTSQMCRRVVCTVAVNGDFFHSTGEPVGAVAHSGRILRSPEENHDQLIVSGAGGLSAGRVNWSARLISSELGSVDLNGLNRQPVQGVTVYTPDYGPSTPVTSGGVEMRLRIVELPRPMGLGQTGLVQLLGFSESGGGSQIKDGEVVLLGVGAGAHSLRELWRRAQQSLLGQLALFRLETSSSMLESIGGSPILIRGGQIAVTGQEHDPTGLITDAHPRTLVGWNANERFLVVVDGRQPDYSVGLALPDAAKLLALVGATEGINLDGGGSSTLTIRGTVVNRPSDRLVVRDGREQIVTTPSPSDTVTGHVERPVADALAVVATSPLAVLGNVLGTDLVSPPAGVPPPSPQDDPASRP